MTGLPPCPRLLTGKLKNGAWTRRASLGRSGPDVKSDIGRAGLKKAFTSSNVEDLSRISGAQDSSPFNVRPSWLHRMRSGEKLHDEVTNQRRKYAS